jgi:hypothetical protein
MDLSLLDATIAVAQALAVNVNVSNFCVVAVKDAGNLFESRTTRGKVSFDSNWLGRKATYRVST